MRLILIRHSLTDDGLKKRYCGIRDIGLNRIGQQKLEEIKTKIRCLKVDTVLSSDLKRSLQTAKTIFGNRGYKIIKNPNLREINFGKWEGFTYNQILKRYPSAYKRWLEDPFSVDIPEGERLPHFILRIKNELKEILNPNRDKTVALVTHAGVIRVILNTLLKIKKQDFWCFKINPCAVYIIEYKAHLKPKIYTLKNG